MSGKTFSQDEVNRIIAVRVKRERERLTKEFENTMNRCMASIQFTLHQEMRTMKQDTAAETNETLHWANKPKERPGLSWLSCEKIMEG